jgi:hypothetical protein
MEAIWCHGQISDTFKNHELDHDDTMSFVDYEDEDDIAAAPPTTSLLDQMEWRKNKDGTLSVFFNRTRISGERLNRGLINNGMVESGHELPRTRCKCPSRRPCQHGQDHGHNHDEHDHSDREEHDDEHSDACREDDESMMPVQI